MRFRGDSNTTLGTDISAWLASVLHEVRSMARSHDARWLASVLHDGTAKIWDLATGQCISTLEAYSTVKIWDSAAGQCITTLECQIV
jgi:WD40 repeat protein